ncbi:MAG: hopanoid biosynthesis-associated protein HpnK [Proteobacteria bacterium]|nr:hopanoid biosynthesis-associated protein HpnK [Pseudomonadota bacterium]
MKGLIVTADDFGAALAVNEAVEHAHTHGILTAASLMVGGAAADDAVARARRLPQLGVGLHIVLADGAPVLPPEQVHLLVGPDGRFPADMVGTAVKIAFNQAAHAQMRAEVAAQFAAFAATGLVLDHVNAHKHFHLHPVILQAILAEGARHGLAAMRLPVEPGAGRLHNAWAGLTGRQLRRAGLLVNDQVAGLADTGQFDAVAMAAALARLRPGLTELYCHPATADQWPGSAPGYRYRDELAALTDPAVAHAATLSGARLGNFASFAAERLAA